MNHGALLHWSPCGGYAIRVYLE